MATAVRALAGLAELSILLLLIYGPWQDYCTARARQNMFIFRARLFDFAASGRLAFDDDVYRRTRSEIERLIRFAHWLTWVRVAFSLYALRQVSSENPLRTLIMQYADADVRAELSAILDGVNRELLWMMVYKSPLLLGSVLLLDGAAAVVRVTGVARAFTTKAWDRRQAVQRSVVSAIWQEADYLGI